MAGGSHTDFNVGSFGVGAVSGAGLIATALASGVANARATQRAHAVHRAIAERDAMIVALQRRNAAQARALADMQRASARRDETITELQLRLRLALHLRNQPR
ncbi:MAG: hypothetical protein J0H32_08210 [Rhizobiales bacterium]|nr:hypothetical protein [Hyphomicrobiales bacterium]